MIGGGLRSRFHWHILTCLIPLSLWAGYFVQRFALLENMKEHCILSKLSSGLLNLTGPLIGYLGETANSVKQMLCARNFPHNYVSDLFALSREHVANASDEVEKVS